MHGLYIAAAAAMLAGSAPALAGGGDPAEIDYDITALSDTLTQAAAPLPDRVLASIHGRALPAAAGMLTNGLLRTMSLAQFDDAGATTMRTGWIATDVWFADTGNGMIFANVRANP